MLWRAIAETKDLAAFRQEFPYYFLVGQVALHRPPRAMATISLDVVTLAGLPPAPTQPATYLTLPVKKNQSTLASMISVGRTANNDLVIEDVQISKFHALFRVRGDVLALEDAGSVNGTKVGNVMLVKGQPHGVRSGDRIAFGSVEFKLLDSGDAWHALRAML